MMKAIKKLTMLVLAAVVAVTAGVLMTGCGGEPEKEAAKITGVYTSNNITFFSAYPGFTYKQLTVSNQGLTLYDDNTYCLSVTDNMLSGALNFPDVATEENPVSYNNRGCSVTNYYGTFTSSEEEGLLSVSIAKPTAVRFTSKINQQGYVNGFFDSENWTDAMATAMGTKDESGTVTPMSKDAFMAKYAFEATELTIDKNAGGFDYVTLTVNKA